MVYEPYHFEVYHYSDENRVNQQTYVYYEDWRDIEDGRYHECELMQYTGLRDKNGKEIYEGDIVAVENEGDVISKCIFELGQFILVDNVGGIWARQLYHQPHRLTIVGNIYENTELLSHEHI